MRAFFLFLAIIIPFAANGQIIISEIMYDLEGADNGREWIEIFNSGSDSVDLTGWKFFEENTNHKIEPFKPVGNAKILAGGYAVISDNPEKFLADWPNFSGIVFNSSFSLKNTGENIILKDSSLNSIDSVNYKPEWGASGDGNSLQKINGEWKAANPTPGNKNNTEAAAEKQTQENQTQQDNFNYDSAQAAALEKPQIKAYAGKDKLGIVGADVEFIGKAWGLKDEPLYSARFVWNFGDGSFQEGKAVKHVYSFPGEYVVVLDVSSGEYSASHIITAKIIPNQVTISEVNSNDFWIRLHNDSNELIDISFWKLKNEKQYFVFPQNSFIKAKSYLTISQSVSGLTLNAKKGKVELLYPNNFLANEFLYQANGQISESKSPAGKETAKPVSQVKRNIKIRMENNMKNSMENNTENSMKNNTEILDFDNAAAPNQSRELDSHNKADVLEVSKNSSGVLKWILIVLGVSVFSGAGFLVLKKYN